MTIPVEGNAPLADVRITLRDVYSAVQSQSDAISEVRSTLQILLERQDQGASISADHEARLRKQEESAVAKLDHQRLVDQVEALKVKVYAASGVAGAIALGAAVYSALK